MEKWAFPDRESNHRIRNYLAEPILTVSADVDTDRCRG